MKHPRLRDSKRLLTHEPFPINEIPEEIIKEIGNKDDILPNLLNSTTRV